MYVCIYIYTCIFLEKVYAKWGEETIPRPFSKKSKLSISLDRLHKVLYRMFLSYGKLRTIKTDYRNIEAKLQTTYFYVI